MLRALHVESHMQEAVIEHLRRVSDHWSYDALGRRGVIVAKLSRQRQLKKSANFCQGLPYVPGPDKNNVTFLFCVEFHWEFSMES